MRPISYNWKETVLGSYQNEDILNINTENICDTCDVVGDNEEILNSQNISEPKDKRIHYGFLAQDVKEIFPDIVTSDDNGQLAIDYNAFIPMLVDRYKKISVQIDDLQKIVTKQQEEIQQLINLIENSKKSYSSGEILNNTDPVLYQNSPNPFSQSTKIKYFVPTIQSNAYINIYDLQGKQIESFIIPQSGSGEILITALSLMPGVYIYNMIVDDNEVTSKRMILTE